MRKLLVVAALALCGCHHGPPSFQGPNGQQGYAVECDGTLRSMASCYRQAAAMCAPRGYEILGQNQQRHLVPNPVNGYPMGIANRSLEVVCKAPEPRSTADDLPCDPKEGCYGP